MSHGHRILAIALAGVLVLAGLAALADRTSHHSAQVVPVATAVATVPSSGAPTRPAATVASSENTVVADPSSVPTTTGVPDANCPDTAHGAIVDRINQRGALSANGNVVYRFPFTSAKSEPDPGTYPVYAKVMNSSSTFGGHYSVMNHFVAFTYGKQQHARIAFHSVPTFTNGKFVQTLASVGTPAMRGQSSGCLRVLPDDSVRIWDWLAVGDKVHVVS